MIIRISTEGQYRLPEALLDRLNELDNHIEEAVTRGDEAAFHKLYAEMVSLVKDKGEPVPHSEIVESEIVLPPPDMTFTEAKNLFAHHDLIPG